MLRDWPAEEFLVIAHRGYSGAAPENTLYACALAYRAGAPMIEIDVTLSADDRLIVLHDDSLDRTTNGAGAAATLAYRQIRRLEAGIWMDSRFQGIHPPALRQILRLAGRWRRMVNVELKPECYRPSGEVDAAQMVVEEIRRCALQQSTLVSSFEWRLLQRVRELEPGLAIALLCEDLINDEEIETLAASYRPFAINPWLERCSRRLCQRAHAAGLRVFPYTANSAEDIRFAQRLGANGVFTNFPERARRIVEGNAPPDLAAEAMQEAAEERMLRDRAAQSWLARRQ